MTKQVGRYIIYTIMIREFQDRILKLKKEKDFCILAHSYMSEEICEVADFVGDSYALSIKAKSVPQKNILMCGVRFMAETVKMLSPEKRVLLANAQAGCPMAEQMDADVISEVKKMYPDYAVVAYINTTAKLKTVADVCVTSSHARVEKEEVLTAKKAHPEAVFLVHPECRSEVVELADFVGSTAGIMDFAVKSDKKEFIIGTENAIVGHLQHMCPDKKFYPLSKDFICHNMKITSLTDILNCLSGDGGEEIVLDEQLRLEAVKCIEKMIEYGG